VAVTHLEHSMNRLAQQIGVVVATIILSAASTAQSQASKLPVVVIETTMGTITAEIDSVRAPVSGANFLKYVDAGAYNGGRFHRAVRMDNQPRDSVKIEVIQGGARQDSTRARFPAIELERTSLTGLKHLDGTLSMARGGPNSATSDFFICIGAQPALDFAGHRNLDGQGFAAFGRVLTGMEIVKAIQQSPVNAQALTPPVTITRVIRRR
jgi:peptidyl-prolyl cis-trans isomerase A (cyclophilin A)